MNVEYINHCGSDLQVVNAARVSFKKASGYSWDSRDADGWRTQLPDKDINLIKYLAEHGHKSPFNHCFITLHVKAPIFIARQLQKHEYMPWNEVSRRYVDDEPEFYNPPEWRKRVADKKQGSGGAFTEEEVADWTEYPVQLDCLREYHRLLERGVAPEMARMVLPLNTYTEWYWSGTLFAWAKMYSLRSSPDAQKEAQEIASQVDEIISPLFLHSWRELILNMRKMI